MSSDPVGGALENRLFSLFSVCRPPPMARSRTASRLSNIIPPSSLAASISLSSRRSCAFPSRVPKATMLYNHTLRDWPILCIRPIRCSKVTSDQGMSQFIRTCAACRSIPSFPASVETITWKSPSWNFFWTSARSL